MFIWWWRWWGWIAALKERMIGCRLSVRWFSFSNFFLIGQWERRKKYMHIHIYVYANDYWEDNSGWHLCHSLTQCLILRFVVVSWEPSKYFPSFFILFFNLFGWWDVDFVTFYAFYHGKMSFTARDANKSWGQNGLSIRTIERLVHATWPLPCHPLSYSYTHDIRWKNFNTVI